MTPVKVHEHTLVKAGVQAQCESEGPAGIALVHPDMTGTKEAALAKQRARPAVAKAEPIVCRGDFGQAALQYRMAADGVEGVAHVDLQHHVLTRTILVSGLHEALQAHAHHFGDLAHAYTALPRP